MIAQQAIHAQATALAERFGRSARAVGVAPGRVELLGNHTDHNRGLVLAAAIDRYTIVAAAPNDSLDVRVWSAQAEPADQFTLPAITPLPRGAWSNYVRAAVAALVDCGVGVRGFDAVVASTVPLGGGLSSSASLECAVAMAVLGLFGRGAGMDPAGMPLAERLQRGEHRIVGVQCGILDQFSSIFGKAGHALFLDCDTLANEAVPLGAVPPAIVVLDSRSPRQLAQGKYNERRAECEAASEFFHRANPQLPRGLVPSLRDVPTHLFLEQQNQLDPVLARRARHVLGENQRVQTGVELLRRKGDPRLLGQLMLESHRSSRENFENSSPELEHLMDSAARQVGFLGGKLSGAGWGGCTVNLVAPEHAQSFASAVTEDYGRRTGIQAQAHICQAADGAQFIRLE